MVVSPQGVTMLAHQGGWDEIAWFAIPIVLVLTWVRWAERASRARREEKEGAAKLPADPEEE